MVLLPGCRCCQSDACFGDWVNQYSLPDSIELEFSVESSPQSPQLTAKTAQITETRNYGPTEWFYYSTVEHTLSATAVGVSAPRQTVSIPVVQELLQFGIAVYPHSLAPQSEDYYIRTFLTSSSGSLGITVEAQHASLTTSSVTESRHDGQSGYVYNPPIAPGTYVGPGGTAFTLSRFQLACSAPSGVVSGGWSALSGFNRAVIANGGIEWTMDAFPRQCGGNPVGMKDYLVTLDDERLFPIAMATRPAVYVSRFSQDWGQPQWYMRNRVNTVGDVQAGGFTKLASPVGIGSATDAAWYAIQSTVTIYGITLIHGTTATPVDGSRLLSLLPGHPAASCVPDWLSYS